MKMLIRSLTMAAFAAGSISAHATSIRVGNLYYEDVFGGINCPNATICRIASSSATPSDNFLRIKHFYCQIETTGTNVLIDILTLDVWTAPPSAGGTFLRKVHLGFPPPVALGSADLYNVDSDIFYLVGQNRYVVLTAGTSASGAITMNCEITGELVPPPQ